MNICEVKNIKIGEGLPKVCVPVVETTHLNIINQLQDVDQLDIDLMELRIDYFEGIKNEAELNHLFEDIQSLSLQKPLILTNRSYDEGGQVQMNDEDYKKIYLMALNYSCFDIYDVELSKGTNINIDLEEAIHQKDKKLIISSHDFHKTHQRDTIIQRLDKMKSFKTDIMKIAMMPEDFEETLNMLEVTHWASEEYDIPLVMMSMSSLGLMTRLIGEQSGSAITFASYGQASAPGQIDYQDLKTVLNIIHKNI